MSEFKIQTKSSYPYTIFSGRTNLGIQIEQNFTSTTYSPTPTVVCMMISPIFLSSFPFTASLYHEQIERSQQNFFKFKFINSYLYCAYLQPPNLKIQSLKPFKTNPTIERENKLTNLASFFENMSATLPHHQTPNDLS